VEALEEHRLVRVHTGVVEPPVAGIEAERIDLAAAIPVAEVARDEVAHRDGARIADGEWRLFHAAANRLPHVDHRNPVAEQPFGFLRREQVAHALRTRALAAGAPAGARWRCTNGRSAPSAGCLRAPSTVGIGPLPRPPPSLAGPGAGPSPPGPRRPPGPR